MARKQKKPKKEDKDRGKEVKTARRINTKRIIWTLVIIILLMALALFYVIFREEISAEWGRLVGNVFEWKGMTWHKTDHKGLMIYSTEIAIYRPVENKTFFYILNLRNDPRKLEKIQADVKTKPQRMVYISFEAEPLQCTDSIVLAAWRVGDFIDALGLKKQGVFANNLAGNISETYENVTHEIKNCSHAEQGTTVILFKESDTDESYIHQEDYCYILEIADCETLETSERFVLALIETMSSKPLE
ncbi:MAG: hypothetical protein IB618_03815 [Candidatus Pacearchaeota archaeon]|nr:MAG: hypothetical protein IB618_03815 [Candidatus Pacearchaeota archaeon]